MATHAGVALELGIVRPQEGKTRYEPRYPLPTTHYPLPTTHYRSLIIKPMPLPPENIFDGVTTCEDGQLYLTFTLALTFDFDLRLT